MLKKILHPRISEDQPFSSLLSSWQKCWVERRPSCHKKHKLWLSKVQQKEMTVGLTLPLCFSSCLLPLHPIHLTSLPSEFLFFFLSSYCLLSSCQSPSYTPLHSFLLPLFCVLCPCLLSTSSLSYLLLSSHPSFFPVSLSLSHLLLLFFIVFPLPSFFLLFLPISPF